VRSHASRLVVAGTMAPRLVRVMEAKPVSIESHDSVARFSAARETVEEEELASQLNFGLSASSSTPRQAHARGPIRKPEAKIAPCVTA